MKLFTLFTALLLFAVPSLAQSRIRSIAITIDDLPVVSTRKDIKNRREITRKLLRHLSDAKAPAIGFVNENKLYTGDKRDEAQVDLLRMWLNAGFELGNHTYSHKSLHDIGLMDYENEILKGETITKGLLAERNRGLRFFRHPYLMTGRTLEIKAGLGTFLKEHGYTIAPITFDNADYIFSSAYDRTYDRGEKKLMKEIGTAYVQYMEKKLEYWERQSEKLFGRDVSQTLLIHANFINSDYIDDVIRMFRKRGYTIVDLETALNDEAYRLPDNYTGRAGISWLHRWALDRGREYIVPDEPAVPDFVLKLSAFTSE
jgi:peptidoglycan/xylan/chitin deacetylase (PgdA/CDA1 family)